uniref:Biogenesis of lysosome-related organelles complex 1 subunit 2 n=1 Tax=Globodera rostochiensis TaxID=31243 RepID=A0A914HLI2_GLORO
MEINERSSGSSECPLSPTNSATTAVVSDEVKQRAQLASDRLYAYMQGQIQGTIDDYKLLEGMNTATSQRYADMEQVTCTISDRLAQLQRKYEELRPFLEQIDEIDEASRRMEAAVSTLETYVSALEAKLKNFHQQNPSR